MVYSAYGSVLLAAGGSGVSYVLGVANGVVADCRAGKAATKNLSIVWTVRDRGTSCRLTPNALGTPGALISTPFYVCIAAINDLLPNFEELLERARAVPQLRIVITLYFTSVSRGLIIRPFSVMPTSSLFVHPSPSAPAGGQLLRSPYTPSSSTAALLAPGNTSAIDVSLDPKTGLVAPPQFIVGRAEEEGNEKTASGSENDDESDDEAYDGISLDEKKNPFSDIHAPPPPSPTTKPRFNRAARAISFSPLRHNADSSSSPPIELKPGRPEYNHIIQHIIEHEQARARSFVETFRVLNPEICETTKGNKNRNRMSGILNASGSGVGRIAVGACGPSGMVASLRKICYDAHGVDFHAE